MRLCELMEHPIIRTARAFLVAIESAENDPCVCLNLGIHDTAILGAWGALKREAKKIPLLAGRYEKE